MVRPTAAMLSALVVLAVACGTDGERDAAPATGEPSPATAPSTTVEPPAAPTPATEAPTTTLPATTVSPTDVPTSAPEPVSDCRVLTDFDHEDSGGWVVVNDGVMGGQSFGEVEFVDSTMRFRGTVVTAGGGFTSVRLPLDGELEGATGLTVRIQSDGRTYGVTLADDSQSGRRTISHGADLVLDGPVDGGGWTEATVDFADLEPTVFGQPVDAEPFDPSAAVEIGFIIADGIDGDFSLTVDWIDACR